MGLDTTHGCWHGAYSAFSRWREAVAEAAGYAVWNVKYDDGSVYKTVMLDWGHAKTWTDPDLFGEWTREPDDPLLYLIVHSDCEGRIYPKHAARLADRLTEILPLMPEGGGGGHVGNWRDTTKTFIDGLRAAVAADEPVEFH